MVNRYFSKQILRLEKVLGVLPACVIRIRFLTQTDRSRFSKSFIRPLRADAYLTTLTAFVNPCFALFFQRAFRAAPEGVAICRDRTHSLGLVSVALYFKELTSLCRTLCDKGCGIYRLAPPNATRIIAFFSDHAKSL